MIRAWAGLVAGLWTVACGAPVETRNADVTERANALIAGYIERYFDTFPTRALEAGRHDFAARLEDFAPARIAAWIAYNRAVRQEIDELEAGAELGLDERLDLELIDRRATLAVQSLAERQVHRSDPLFWTRPLGNATVFLLVREDAPLEDRLRGAVSRAAAIPRLASQARAALADGGDEIAPEIAAIAARQAASSARFYETGFVRAAKSAGAKLEAELAEAAGAAQRALADLAAFLETVAAEATGSPRLGEDYAARFAAVTGEPDVSAVLARAEAALEAKVAETAVYGREVWTEVFADRRQRLQPPAADAAVIRRLFDRISEDRAVSVEDFVGDYEQLLEDSVALVRKADLITLPEPLTVHTARSPSFFVGQAVGGVYAAGPYSPPDAKTLFFLPTPPESLTGEQREGFFRDFNHHFNVMITPHEMVPGHYLQLKLAARHPRKARALFGDGVYIEGWGTFCERLMLDLGWGGPMDRLAHLKKQLENIARTIVDIRVHTGGMTREEVLDYVREEAFQDEQFASSMWSRAITSSPQLTSYFLGYERVRTLFEDVRAARGEGFVLKEFMDGMMEMGPVPVARYRERMLGGGGVAR